MRGPNENMFIYIHSYHPSHTLHTHTHQNKQYRRALLPTHRGGGASSPPASASASAAAPKQQHKQKLPPTPAAVGGGRGPNLGQAEASSAAWAGGGNVPEDEEEAEAEIDPRLAALQVCFALRPLPPMVADGGDGSSSSDIPPTIPALPSVGDRRLFRAVAGAKVGGWFFGGGGGGLHGGFVGGFYRWVRGIGWLIGDACLSCVVGRFAS